MGRPGLHLALPHRRPPMVRLGTPHRARTLRLAIHRLHRLRRRRRTRHPDLLPPHLRVLVPLRRRPPHWPAKLRPGWAEAPDGTPAPLTRPEAIRWLLFLGALKIFHEYTLHTGKWFDKCSPIEFFETSPTASAPSNPPPRPPPPGEVSRSDGGGSPTPVIPALAAGISTPSVKPLPLRCPALRRGAQSTTNPSPRQSLSPHPPQPPSDAPRPPART